MALAAGRSAPDFTLKTKTPEGLADVKLSSNFGKKNTVLLFFPLAFTGTCTKEMCGISSGLNVYKKLDAEVYGISVDSPFAQEAWAKQEKIQVTLLSDLDKKIAQAYDVLLPDVGGGIGSTSARAAFVINKDGIIIHSEQTPTTHDLPDFEIIQQTLKSA